MPTIFTICCPDNPILVRFPRMKPYMEQSLTFLVSAFGVASLTAHGEMREIVTRVSRLQESRQCTWGWMSTDKVT